MEYGKQEVLPHMISAPLRRNRFSMQICVMAYVLYLVKTETLVFDES